MILTALNDYYQRLLANPDPVTGLAKVPPYGFSEQQISYCLVLSKDGELVDIEDVRDTSAKKPKPKLMSVPSPFVRSGQYTQKTFDSGKDNAFFLWDKTAYSLGVSLANDVPTFAAIAFASFKRFHLASLEATEDVALQAVYLFIKNWVPENFAETQVQIKHIDANFVFRLDGDLCFVHERPAAQALWLKLVQPEEGVAVNTGDCLVTGQVRSPLARLHPPIKGGFLVRQGGQSSGSYIVSFNDPAYASYGKEQGDNAPISETVAFGYTTSLNYLLRSGNGQCIPIGDTSTVFWAVAADAGKASAAESLFGWMLNMPANDGSQVAQLKPVLEKIAQGKPLAEIAPDLAEGTRFYVLGLAPNASRLSIRYWMDTSFGELATHVAQHFKDLTLDPLPWLTTKPPAVQKLLLEVVPLRKKDGQYDYGSRKFDDIPPQLAGELIRSVLTGQAYPKSLLAKILQRVRSDGDISRLRVSIVKAILCRQHRLTNSNLQKESISMGLNKDDQNVAYRLGRLFAVLEKAQSAALGQLNAGIVDRYYGAASSTPQSIFPSLLQNAKNHLSSLRKGRKADWVKDANATAGWLDKEIGLIILSLTSDHPFPKNLTLDEQGRFLVGYYHQRYTTQNDAPQDLTINVETITTTTGD
jgi:CRISPR-associated protein Csd1